MKKEILVCGAGGFIGHHLVNRLVKDGHNVVGVDLKYPEYEPTKAQQFFKNDLRDFNSWQSMMFYKFDEIYQLAADMGGAGYVFTGDNDAQIMHNSAQINLNCLEFIRLNNPSAKVFFSSSACVYPEYKQTEATHVYLMEQDAYPACPDSEYGWEKLFSERLYMSYHRNFGIDVRIARFHNIFGPLGSWDNGKEKAPAAICRKVAMANLENNYTVKIWGNGSQTRTFLYIDECIEGVLRLMASDYREPINIGSEMSVTIEALVHVVSAFDSKKVTIVHEDGPIGVNGRGSSNQKINEVLGWSPAERLVEGLGITYNWIKEQIKIKYPNGKAGVK